MSTYDRVSWQTFLRDHFQWSQGQHVLVAAPTGVGKTHLATSLVNRSGRRNAVMFVSKTKDDIFRKSLFNDWTVIRKWPPPRYVHRALLWPNHKRGATIPDMVANQRWIFEDALNAIMHENGWCLIFDEQHWFCDPSFLGLAKHNAALQHVGRSAGFTVVNLTQRPAWVPVVTYSSASHAFIGHTRDRNDLKRLSDLGGADPKELAQNLIAIDPEAHELVYVPTRTNANPLIVKVGR